MGDVEELPPGAEHVSVSRADEFGASVKRPEVSRRLALLTVAGIVLVFALGWAADGLALFAPAVHFTNGAMQQAGPYRVALTLDPATPHSGQAQRYTLRVTDSSGHLVSGAHVHLRFSMVTMDMPVIDLTATATGNGAYTASGALSMPGEWHLSVTLSPPAGSPRTTQFDIAVR